MRREQKDLREFRGVMEKIHGLHTLELAHSRAGRFEFERGLFGQVLDIQFFTGAFFEELHSALYGTSKPLTSFHLVKPDFMTDDSVGDVKACSVKKDLPFRAEQLEGYLGVEHETGKKSYHVFYLHNGIDGRSNERDVCVRASSLAGRILGALHIPGSLAVLCCNAALDSSNNLVRYSDRNERGTWIYISTSGVRQLFEEPGEFIFSVGGDPSQYAVSRSISPRGFKIGDYGVARFPIVQIHDVRERGLSGARVPEKLLRASFNGPFDEAGLFDGGFDAPDSSGD